jgi:hypothetical protein
MRAGVRGQVQDAPAGQVARRRNRRRCSNWTKGIRIWRAPGCVPERGPTPGRRAGPGAQRAGPDFLLSIPRTDSGTGPAGTGGAPGVKMRRARRHGRPASGRNFRPWDFPDGNRPATGRAPDSRRSSAIPPPLTAPTPAAVRRRHTTSPAFPPRHVHHRARHPASCERSHGE